MVENDQLKQQIIREYYEATMIDLAHGVPLDDIVNLMYHFEALEEYEICAGIKRALDDIEKAKGN